MSEFDRLFGDLALHPDDDAPEPVTPQSDGLPSGYTCRGGAIFWDGGDEPALLAHGLRVLATTRSREGADWGRLVSIIDLDGTAHRLTIPAAAFAGDGLDVLAAIYERGIAPTTDRNQRAALLRLLAAWQPEARATCTDRLGWTGPDCQTFVLGDGRTLGDSGVVFQSERAAGPAAEMRERGSLDQWRETVAAHCVLNPVLMASICVALAGPLLEPLGAEGIGLHLRGSSSRGKSTALRLAASVWGGPGFVQSWRATSNALESVAAACNGSVLILDELGQVAGREAGEVAYMAANGSGKSRASRTGGARPVARWRCALLSSGEISLETKMAEAGQRQRAGQAVRFLDIAATERRHGAFDYLHGHPDGATFSRTVTAAAAAAYGTAGPAFVSRLIDGGEAALAEARSLQAAFRAAAEPLIGENPDGQVLRALDRFGLLSAAGELATSWGLTGWACGDASDAALDLFAAWLGQRGGAGSGEDHEAISRTRAFIAAHGASRFEVPGDAGGRRQERHAEVAARSP